MLNYANETPKRSLLKEIEIKSQKNKVSISKLKLGKNNSQRR